MDKGASGIPSADTAEYRATFYGILNAQGYFWTPLIFEREEHARGHIASFWGAHHEKREWCFKHFKIVPVRAVITLAQGMEAATAGETEGLDPADESPVAESHAHTLSPETNHG